MSTLRRRLGDSEGYFFPGAVNLQEPELPRPNIDEVATYLKSNLLAKITELAKGTKIREFIKNSSSLQTAVLKTLQESTSRIFFRGNIKIMDSPKTYADNKGKVHKEGKFKSEEVVIKLGAVTVNVYLKIATEHNDTSFAHVLVS